MEPSSALASSLFNFCTFEIVVALVFGYKFAWSEERVSVEAGLVELFDRA